MHGMWSLKVLNGANTFHVHLIWIVLIVKWQMTCAIEAELLLSHYRQVSILVILRAASKVWVGSIWMNLVASW